MAFTFLTAVWRKLIMAQYEVAPEVLERRLPPGLELDLYQGRCFVSLVGFLFDRVRILRIPVPGHTRFEEVNLRFYVRRRLPDDTCRRGVVFLSEIVPRPAITLVARALYGEAYATAPTAHRWSGLRTVGRPAEPLPGAGTAGMAGGAPPVEIEYEWRHRGVWQRLAVRADARRVPIPAGSLEEFITEHYFGYAPRRGGGTTEYAVHHPRWETYPVLSQRVACDFGALYGGDFAALSTRPPDHLLLAEGAPVSIRWGGRIA